MWATDVTFDATKNKTSSSSLTIDGITIATSNGNLNNGTDYRNFRGATFKISSTVGNITSVAFTSTSDTYAGYIKISGTTPGSLSTSGSTTTWTYATGATSITFTGKNGNSNEQLRLSQIIVTYASSEPSISANDVNITASATVGSISYTINNAVTGGALTAAKTSDSDWLTVGAVSASAVAFTTEENTGAARSATVRLTYTYDTNKTVTKNVTVTQAKAIGTYALATSITSGKHYIIVSKDGSNYVAMGYDKGNNRAAVNVTESSSTITGTEDVYEFTFYGPDANGRYTIYDETKNKEGYLYAAASGSNYLKTQEVNNINGKWKIGIDSNTGVASIVADGSSNRNVMQYNSSSTIFSCYGSASQKEVYLYEKNSDTPVATSTSINLNGSGYATYATTTALDFLDAEKATFSAWQITGVSGSTITFEQITSHVRAGAGILLKGTANATININILPFGGGALSGNKLVGITTATDVAADTYYGLSGNQFKKVGAGTVPAGKALLPASEVAGARELTFVFEDATGIKQVENAKMNVEGIYNLNGQKVLNPTKGLYIMNGKKVILK